MSPHFAPVWLVLAMMIVGSTVVAGKLLTETLPIFLASTLRFALAVTLMAPFVHLRKMGLPSLSSKSWVLIALQALFGSFLASSLLLKGLTYTSAASAGVISATTPAAMALVAWGLFREKLSFQSVVAIGLAVSGVLLIQLQASNEVVQGNQALFGNGLILLMVICEALFLLLGKLISERVTPFMMAYLMSLFGLLFFLPMGLYEALESGFELSSLTIQDWWVLTYYAVFITILAYLFWFAGVAHAPVSISGVSTAVMPVSALILAVIVLHEPLSLYHIAGCALVLAAIVITTRRSKARVLADG